MKRAATEEVAAACTISSGDVEIPLTKKQVLSPSYCYVTPTPPDSMSFADDNDDDENDDDCANTGTSIAISTVTSLCEMPAEDTDVMVVFDGANEALIVNNKDSNSNYHQLGDYRTGLVFEAGSGHFDRRTRLHRERPSRVEDIRESLRNDPNGLWSRCCVLGDDENEQEGASANNNKSAATQFLDDEDFSNSFLILIFVVKSCAPLTTKTNKQQSTHSFIPIAFRLDNIFDCTCCTQERLDQEAEQYQSIYFAKESLSEAKQAAASLCSLVERVVRGHLDHGFAVIRPPGHHAEPFQAGGYCIINNVAVATAYARAKLGVRKILIVDWDVHHGNGTQAIFQQDPNVLYFSVHRWHGGTFYPYGGANGGPNFVGKGPEGEGFNVNVGWTAKGMGDDEYLAVWERLLLPMATEFQPDLIMISAGFDAAEGDVGECCVSPECYGRLTQRLMTLNVPIVCALEGGYVRSVLGNCVRHVVTALLDRQSGEKSRQEGLEDAMHRDGDDTDVLDTIATTAAKNIRATIAAHQSYWTCLHNPSSKSTTTTTTESSFNLKN